MKWGFLIINLINEFRKVTFSAHFVPIMCLVSHILLWGPIQISIYCWIYMFRIPWDSGTVLKSCMLYLRAWGMSLHMQECSWNYVCYMPFRIGSEWSQQQVDNVVVDPSSSCVHTYIYIFIQLKWILSLSCVHEVKCLPSFGHLLLTLSVVVCVLLTAQQADLRLLLFYSLFYIRCLTGLFDIIN